nr:PAS domain-containing protein [Vibrio eleionomae]
MGEATADGLWDLTFIPGRDFDEDYPFWWSQGFRHLLGFNDERDFPNVARSWSDRLHPEDKQPTFDAFMAHLNDKSGQTGYDVQYRLSIEMVSIAGFKPGELRYGIRKVNLCELQVH